jgi:hypothetical protein
MALWQAHSLGTIAGGHTFFVADKEEDKRSYRGMIEVTVSIGQYKRLLARMLIKHSTILLQLISLVSALFCALETSVHTLVIPNSHTKG